MKLFWLTSLLCWVTIKTSNEQAAVRNLRISPRSQAGERIHVGGKRNDSAEAKAYEDISQRCLKHVMALLGEISDKSVFKRETLSCEYRELQERMRRAQKEDERSLREGNTGTEIKNPYKREFTDEIVNPHNFLFIHQPKPCESRHTLLVTVHSATQHHDKRLAIRNTWGNPRILGDFLPKGHATKLIFILGVPKNISNQTMIDYEAEAYQDIVQADFRDHYYNNTYKAIYNMKWISGYGGCPKASLVIKVDDDIMFNLRKFPGFWKNFTGMLKNQELSPHAMLLAGNKFGGGPPRNPESKWYIPYDVFQYDTFPPWFQGMVYFLTPALAAQIYQLSFTTKYIFTDDVYVGIVADRVKTLTRYNLAHFYAFVYEPLDKKLLKWRFDPLVFYHNPSTTEMYSLWFFYCSYVSCA